MPIFTATAKRQSFEAIAPEKRPVAYARYIISLFSFFELAKSYFSMYLRLFSFAYSIAQESAGATIVNPDSYPKANAPIR